MLADEFCLSRPRREGVEAVEFQTHVNDTFELAVKFSDGTSITKSGALVRNGDSDKFLASIYLKDLSAKLLNIPDGRAMFFA